MPLILLTILQETVEHGGKSAGFGVSCIVFVRQIHFSKSQLSYYAWTLQSLIVLSA